MNFEKFNRLCSSNSTWSFFKSALLEHWYSEKIHRESILLSMNAEQKYLHFIKRHKRIIHRIPQYYIASYLGISPETLSRVRKKYLV